MAIQNDDAAHTSGAQTAVPTPAPSRASGGIGRFLREVMVELKKTQWPGQHELTKLTTVVMITILVSAVCLFVMDLAAQFLMKNLGITS